jgi:hypothetical protein
VEGGGDDYCLQDVQRLRPRKSSAYAVRQRESDNGIATGISVRIAGDEVVIYWPVVPSKLF